MDYLTWKVVHLAGLLLLFAALGGVAALQHAGAVERAGRLYKALHGIALLVVLGAGFGALATIGLHSPAQWPAWVWIKLAVWLVLGAGLVVLEHSGRRSGLVLLGLVAVGGIAAWASLMKPTL